MDYRKNAEECRRHAQDTRDAPERETFLRMAAQWDRLAQQKARKESEEREAASVAGLSHFRARPRRSTGAKIF
jgi:hypothetical protein